MSKWKFRPAGRITYPIIEIDRDRRIRLLDDPGSDGYLMSAAPDLLDALQAIVNQHDVFAIVDDENIEAARAAIAKAKGE